VVTPLQGEVWWVEYPEPVGSEPGFRRPVLVLQGNAFNRSALQTVVVVPLTSQLKWEGAPGNVRLAARDTGLPKASVANITGVGAVDRSLLVERAGMIPAARFQIVLRGLDLMLGRG
jgi:mRNA interferase MazF